MRNFRLDYYRFFTGDTDFVCEKGKVEIAKVGETSIGRAYFEPGWS